MPIRPIDVRRKEFKNGFRGYDANQVDDFLDAVADEFERTYTDNARLREEISGLRERLQQFEELEGSIRSALVHAEQAANDLRRTANWEAEDLRKSASREAELTIREAQARSHQMLAESSARVERIQESYEALLEAKRGFTNDFRHLLKTYMDMMENMEIASAREIEASLRQRLDTESIAVAREAATREEEYVEPVAPEFEAAEQEPGVELEEELAAEDAGTTQRMEPAAEAPQTEPEVEEPEAQEPEIEGAGVEEPEPEEPEVVEPEIEPSTATQDAEREPAVAEPPATEEPPVAEEPPASEEPAAEEVEREEPTLAEESSSQSFFDREESSGEGGRDSRIFRASRFLRRRE
jgi:cell division initiation protein